MRPRRNPTWALDGLDLDIDEGPTGEWSYRIRGVVRDVESDESYATHDEALRAAMREASNYARPIAIIGDVHPLSHGGGVVMENPSEGTYGVLYFDPFTRGDDDWVGVYEFDVEPDVMADLSFVDWQSLGRTMDMDRATIRRLSASRDPVQRALLYEAVGHYQGFDSLDSYPHKFRLDNEAEVSHYERLVDVAHKALRRATPRRNPGRRTRQRRLARLLREP